MPRGPNSVRTMVVSWKVHHTAPTVRTSTIDATSHKKAIKTFRTLNPTAIPIAVGEEGMPMLKVAVIDKYIITDRVWEPLPSTFTAR